MALELKIIPPESSVDDILNLSVLSGPSNKRHYKKIMLGFIANSISEEPDLDRGIVYGFYKNNDLIASARIKQDEYTSTAMSIEYIAVQEKLQRKGIGKLFMDALFKEIKEKWGKKLAMLATSKKQIFYEKIGMQTLGKIMKKDKTYRIFMYKWL